MNINPLEIEVLRVPYTELDLTVQPHWFDIYPGLCQSNDEANQVGYILWIQIYMLIGSMDTGTPIDNHHTFWINGVPVKPPTHLTQDGAQADYYHMHERYFIYSHNLTVEFWNVATPIPGGRAFVGMEVTFIHRSTLKNLKAPIHQRR